MRLILSILMAGLITIGSTSGAFAQPAPHPPQIKEESNADHYHYEFDNGICHYNYEINWKDQREHIDRHGDCEGVAIPRTPMPPQ